MGRSARKGERRRLSHRRLGLQELPKSLESAIARAERVLPGTPAPEGEIDPRWQAIIGIGWFLEEQPEPVWEFVSRWGKHPNADLRMAVATCLLEHLLEHHFELIFPRVVQHARRSVRFADTFTSCWKFGQAKLSRNEKRFDALIVELVGPRFIAP